MPLPTTNNENTSQKQEKPFEEMISDLITQRKLQQEALVKIKASVEKRQSDAISAVNEGARKKNKRKLNLKPKK